MIVHSDLLPCNIDSWLCDLQTYLPATLASGCVIVRLTYLQHWLLVTEWLQHTVHYILLVTHRKKNKFFLCMCIFPHICGRPLYNETAHWKFMLFFSLVTFQHVFISNYVTNKVNTWLTFSMLSLVLHNLEVIYIFWK